MCSSNTDITNSSFLYFKCTVPGCAKCKFIGKCESSTIIPSSSSDSTTTTITDNSKSSLILAIVGIILLLIGLVIAILYFYSKIRFLHARIEELAQNLQQIEPKGVVSKTKVDEKLNELNETNYKLISIPSSEVKVADFIPDKLEEEEE